jgi:hypothetical protein
LRGKAKTILDEQLLLSPSSVLAAHCDSSMLRCGSLRRQPWASHGDLCTLHRQHLGCRRLVVGEIYEVMHINERDGLYALSGLGRFTMTRFELVSAAEAGYWPSRRRRSPVPSPPKRPN